MILIVESGATKTDWSAVAPGRQPVNIRTAGINLAIMSEAPIEAIVLEAVEALRSAVQGFCGSEKVEEIHFYAAGLIIPEETKVPALAGNLNKVLANLFPDAVIEYASDLLDAARAVCGHQPGIAAILGTGSNSCFYDGTRIVKNVHSSGFILGDEGGGARLGKIFLSDFLKGLVPESLSDEFASCFEVDYLTVVRNVYRSDAPAKYLGSFAPWILERYASSDYARSIVDGNFKDFIERALKQYDIKNYPVGVVGGLGNAASGILKKVAEPYGISFSKIIATSMEGLVEYHSSDFTADNG